MPSLKQLTCHVEWGSSNVPFKEYGTAYGDGVVDTYIAIPNHPTTFSINLKSHGYIAPGLAMFVFADGVYQCNRNRDQLVYPKNPISPDEMDRKRSEVDFRVRQKEEDAVGDIFTGRQWRFEPLNLVKPSSRGTQADPASHFKYLGTIQVVVLRCAARSGQIATSWDEDELSEPLSPESATAPVLDTEDEDDVKKAPSASVKLADTLWAVYDGPSDGWQTYDPQSSRRYSNGSHTERKVSGARERSDSRDIDWGGSQGSRRSTNPSVVVNIHTHGSQGSNSEWPNRPLSPETQLNSGCYNIKDGKRVHGSQEWRQEKSPSINGHSWSGDNNDTQWNTAPADDSWAQTNGDRASTSQSNGQGNNDPWVADDHNASNGNWGRSSPVGDYWATSNEQNDPTSNTADWGAPSNDQNDQSGNDLSNNNGGDTWGAEDSTWGNLQETNTDADAWASGNDNQNNNDSPQNGVDWGNSGDNKSADNNDNGAWGNDESNQEGPSSVWDTDNNDNNNGGDVQNDNTWGSPNPKEGDQVDYRQTSPIPPIQPQPQVYCSPSSHGDFPNRLGGSKPAVFVTPRVVQEPRNDEPLLYTVPADVAKEKLTTHQVQPGPSALYQKKIVTPDYIDTIEKPYAMFVFKYRKTEVIEQMLGMNIERDVEIEKKKLEALPRDVIIDQLLRAQGIFGDNTSPPTHNGQKGKQKLRAEFPVPNNYTTTPLVPVNAAKSQGAPQHTIPPYAAMPPPATATWVDNTTGWGGPTAAQPTQSTNNQTPTVNKSNKSGYENLPPLPSSTGPPPPASPTAVDRSGAQNQPAPDTFLDSLNNKLQNEADKRSVASKDSWSTRTSSDARKRDAARGVTSNVSLGKESSKSKSKQPNNPQGGMVMGPVQTYRPSNSNPRPSPQGGSKKDSSGNSGQPAVAPTEPVW